MPGQGPAAAAEDVALPVAQGGAGFYEMEIDGVEQCRHAPHHPQGVGQQRAATGAEFDEAQGPRRPHGGPDRGRPGADQFAEHLGGLGGGDEIAGGAEGVAGNVVPERRVAEAQGHETVDADRPSVEDQGADLVAEAAHARAADRRAGRIA